MSEQRATHEVDRALVPTPIAAAPPAPPARRVPGIPFKPGNNANPGGRPKGFGAYVREQTRDGKELVDVALEIVRAKRKPVKYRLQALEWLSDRGWGKPVQSHELMGEGGGAVVFTLRLGEREGGEE